MNHTGMDGSIRDIQYLTVHRVEYFKVGSACLQVANNMIGFKVRASLRFAALKEAIFLMKSYLFCRNYVKALVKP